MRPIELLFILVGVLIAILIIDRIFRRRRACLIAAVGADFRMNYSPLDRFALSDRLASSQKWVLRSSDLTVKDVLYTTQHGERCFVATVKCRWSLDQDESRFVVRVLEQADHQSEFELKAIGSEKPREDVGLYRKLISEWSSAAPTLRNPLTAS